MTFPAALAAGIRHLRRYIAAEGSPLAAFWRDLRAALAGGLVVGFIALVLTAILLLDVDLANSGLLPGGAVVAVIGWVGLAVVAVALLAAAGAWCPAGGWRGAVRSVPRTLAGDIPGTLYLAATAGSWWCSRGRFRPCSSRRSAAPRSRSSPSRRAARRTSRVAPHDSSPTLA